MALWFHVTGCTYGTWLPGDDRSFRTRHHHEHIEGDVESPPPEGTYEDRLAQARELMREAGREPVRLSADARRIAIVEMVDSLQRRGAEVRIACLDDHHFHILLRLPGASVEEPRDCDPWASRPTDSQSRASKPTDPNRWASSDLGNYLPEIRALVGNAKRCAARALVKAAHVSSGGVWATRMHMRRVADEAHLREAVAYIAEHGEREAAVWVTSA